MDNTAYITLTRQQGLTQALESVANNLANMSTTGFRAERVLFSEFVAAVESEIGSVSMARANPRFLDAAQAELTQTNGPLDIAIEGDGFLMVQTPNGQRLTRAGAMALSPEGVLVTMEGAAVLDAGGAPIFAAVDASELVIAADGTVSAGDAIVGQIGVYTVENPAALRHAGGTLMTFEGEPLAAENARVMQGFLENSNVDPIFEISMMINIQRAYELGQSLMSREDERTRAAIRTLGEAI